MTLRRLVLVLVLAAGCKVDPRDLAPFPCPKDRDCPSGLACFGGSCVHACKDGEGCSAAESCTEPVGLGYCVTDCAPNPGLCAAPTVCQSLYFGGHKGCLPAADAGVSPCAEVKVAACGSTNLCDGRYQTACGDGTFCPNHSACVGAGASAACACGDGYEAVDCDGASCDGRPCALFWCRERDIAARCDAKPDRFTQFTCICKDPAKKADDGGPYVAACDSDANCFNYCNESN